MTNPQLLQKGLNKSLSPFYAQFAFLKNAFESFQRINTFLKCMLPKYNIRKYMFPKYNTLIFLLHTKLYHQIWLKFAVTHKVILIYLIFFFSLHCGIENVFMALSHEYFYRNLINRDFNQESLQFFFDSHLSKCLIILAKIIFPPDKFPFQSSCSCCLLRQTSPENHFISCAWEFVYIFPIWI